MSFLPYYHARRRLLTRSNFAGDFSEGIFGAIDIRGIPEIGDLDFRLECRVNLQNHVYGNFIGGNSDASLEAFCLFHRNGELLCYVQAPKSGKSIFRAINTADQGAIGRWLRVGYERIGNTIYGLVEGQRVWAEEVGQFTVDKITTLNISYRGGGGGGVNTFHYMDWLTLDLGTGPSGQFERWLNFQFNEADGPVAINEGKLGGTLDINGSATLTHILI